MGKSQKTDSVPENKKDSVKSKQIEKDSAVAGSGDIQNKYNKLKKRYKYLREEYTKVLESWELGAKSIKSLLDERKFLKKKLDTFFKSQNFIDEQIFKQNGSNDPVVTKKQNVDLTGQKQSVKQESSVK